MKKKRKRSSRPTFESKSLQISSDATSSLTALATVPMATGTSVSAAVPTIPTASGSSSTGRSCQWIVHETKQGTWYIPLVAVQQRDAMVRYLEEHYLKWCRQWSVSISPSLIPNGGTGLIAHNPIPKNKILWYDFDRSAFCSRSMVSGEKQCFLRANDFARSIISLSYIGPMSARILLHPSKDTMLSSAIRVTLMRKTQWPATLRVIQIARWGRIRKRKPRSISHETISLSRLMAIS